MAMRIAIGGSVSSGRSVRDTLAGGWARLALMMRARRTRLMLAEMEPRMLADIGASRGDAIMEASRAFWDTETRRHG